MRRAGPSRLAFLTARPFAHRGLHGPGLPENSLAAAQAAIAGGYGIECDVRLSRDGAVYVFHDKSLTRLTGRTGRLADLNNGEAAALRLLGTEEAPPPLAALLALCTATPLLIELKSDGGRVAIERLCAAVARALKRHHGPAAVMSFDPAVCRWFACHAPRIIRGMVVSTRHRRGKLMRRTKGLEIMAVQAHFLACDVRDLPLTATRPRGMPLLCWTVRTPRQRALARRRKAQIIFEA